MTLTILQDNTRTELVSVNIIEALYNIAKNPNNTVSLEGRLEATGTYGDSMQYLNENFTDFIITVQNQNNIYYRFLDAECEKILSNYFAVSHISINGILDKFKAGTPSNHMDFLKNAFRSKSALRIVDLRPFDFYMFPNSTYYGTNKLNIYGQFIEGSNNVTEVYIGKFPIFTCENNTGTDVYLDKFACYKCENFLGGAVGRVYINKLAFFNITELTGYSFRSVKVTDLYIGNTTPPNISMSYGSSLNNISGNIYVPIGSASTYTSDSNFTGVASKIQEYDFNSDPDNIFGGMNFTL